MGRERKDDMRMCGGGKMAKGGSFLKIKHPGSLRAALGAKKGQPIPAAKLEAATHSDNPKTRRRAILAETMRGWHHK